jgi:hypothetical protein
MSMKEIRNCLILGSGRSGTSMLAGSLSSSGYYMGDCLIEANEANPKGFFEDYEVNAINEELLTPMTATFEYGWRWLASVDIGTAILSASWLDERITTLTSKTPFCFKDPRFCYTLPAWRPFLSDTVFLCIFREPVRTANSIVTECRKSKYLSEFPMDFPCAIDVWALMYHHILKVHRHIGDWRFFHYDQLVDGTAIAPIEEALGVSMIRSFPDVNLKRSSSEGQVSTTALELYRELCALANYRA